MKRSSPSYRLQLIKEVAMRKQHEPESYDPMASYIKQLMEEKPSGDTKNHQVKRSFSGSHFDEQAGGWVSDRWSMK